MNDRPKAQEGQVMAPQPVAVAQLGDVDVQVATAQAIGRDVPAVVERIAAVALLDRETAAGCMYFVPRAGKFIEGYSIRFAEMVASEWRHLRTKAFNVLRSREKGRKGIGFVVARAECWDLFSNVAWSKDATVIVYSEDGWELAEANAQAKAARDAILKTVPQGTLLAVKRKIREKILGDSEDLTHYTARLLAYLDTQHGVKLKDVERFLGAGKAPVPRAKWVAEHCFVLGVTTANIKDPDSALSAAEAFGLKPRPEAKAKAEVPQAATEAPLDERGKLVAELRKLQGHPKFVEVLDAIGAFPTDLEASTTEQLADSLRALKEIGGR